MNFAALRSAQSKLSIAFVASAALLLGSCGGGGASTSPLTTGSLQILPATGSLYAGVPYTFTIAGGRRPYLIVADEPTILPLNATVTGNTITVIPNNPGVVDTGLQTGEVPRRTVNVQVRDSANETITARYNVLQNFFTGYGESYTSTCAASASSQTPTQACSGLDTIVRLAPISQGTLYGNRELQFDKIRGDWQFVQEPPGATPQLLNSVRVRSDQQGIAFIRIRVAVGAVTQLATYRVTDVQTGTTTDLIFLITQQQPSTAITIIPNTFTFTGGLAGTCGAGVGAALVLDGAPPYTAVSSSVFIIAAPTPILNNGDTINIQVPNGITVCPTGTVVVTDSQGARATITVTSQAGTGAAPAIQVSPASLTLTCLANSASAAVVGGSGSLAAVSSHPRVTGVISGNTITVTRAIGDGATVYPTTATIAITDGATIQNLTVTVPANCP